MLDRYGRLNERDSSWIENERGGSWIKDCIIN